MEKLDLQIEELESTEEMMSDFATGFCYGVIIVGGLLCTVT